MLAQHKSQASALLLALWLGCAPEIVGTITADLADALSPSERHVFLSRQAINGNIKVVYGSLEGACATFAAQSGLKRRYQPIITDSAATMSERVGAAGPIFLVDRNFEKHLVANDPSEMWGGNLQRPIDIDQFGDAVPAGRAWTGRRLPDVRTCEDWTAGNGASSGNIGDPTQTNALWYSTGTTSDCFDSAGGGGRRLYCISD